MGVDPANIFGSDITKQSRVSGAQTFAFSDNGCGSDAQFERIARWSMLASKSGFVDFLSPEDGFKSCLPSGRAWSNKDEPGIYFWLASDGEAYVGQSITPQSRLRQHWRDHRDISHACFMPCPPEELNRAEEKLISHFDKHFPLRNVKHAVTTSSEVPFDKLISDEERERFLAGENLPDVSWRDFPLLTRLQARRFDKFFAVDGGLEALIVAATSVRA